MGMLILFSSFILAYTFYKYDLTVGTLSLEDYYLFSYIFQKPWGKFHGPAFGCLIGWLYLNIKSYWNLTDAKKPTWRILFYFHSKFWPSFLIALIGFLLFNFILFYPYDPNNDAYSWSKAQNVTYTFFSNMTYAFGIACMTQFIFFKKVRLIETILGADIFVYLSKLVYA